jgi:YidC/Oxa1 family membrane protein insertase
LTGCTKVLEDPETKKAVTNPITGQNLTENILCKPKDKDSIKLYEEYKEIVDIEKLPACKNFKITSGGYEGLWTSFFVKPLSWFLIKVAQVVKSHGFAIILVGFLLRALLLPMSIKSSKMSENMSRAQRELNRIETKYKGRDDQDSMMAKSQEMMMIYKKYNINPMSSCLFSFIQLPLFFAFLEAVYRVPAFFETSFLGVYNLGVTPLEGLRMGNYWYLILIVLILGATYFSFKNMNNTSGDIAQQQQMKMMSAFMVLFIGIASVSLQTSIALYWIVSNRFTIVQNLIIKKGKM